MHHSDPPKKFYIKVGEFDVNFSSAGRDWIEDMETLSTVRDDVFFVGYDSANSGGEIWKNVKEGPGWMFFASFGDGEDGGHSFRRRPYKSKIKSMMDGDVIVVRDHRDNIMKAAVWSKKSEDDNGYVSVYR